MNVQAEQTRQFAELLTEHQPRIWAFVFSQIAEPELANDAFQETNRVLWEKAGDYDPERPFLAWAFGVARMQARSFRQARARDRLMFDPDVVAALADHSMQRAESMGDRQLALATCVHQLDSRQRDTLRRRYEAGDSVVEIGAALGRSPNAVAVALHRIRQSLSQCVEAIAQGSGS